MTNRPQKKRDTLAYGLMISLLGVTLAISVFQSYPLAPDSLGSHTETLKKTVA